MAGRLVEDEIRAGVSPERIAIGGFSQGGHVSLKYLFNAKHLPAACIALSTWLEPTFNREVSKLQPSFAQQSLLCIAVVCSYAPSWQMPEFQRADVKFIYHLGNCCLGCAGT